MCVPVMTFPKSLITVFLLCAAPAAADEAQRDMARQIERAAANATEATGRLQQAQTPLLIRKHSMTVEGCQITVKSVSRRHDGMETSIDEVTFDLARASLPVSPEAKDHRIFEIEFAPRYKPTAYTTTHDATIGLPVSRTRFETAPAEQSAPGRLLALLTEYQARYCAPAQM